MEFSELAKKLLPVPHIEIKRKLDEDKTMKASLFRFPRGSLVARNPSYRFCWLINTYPEVRKTSSRNSPAPFCVNLSVNTPFGVVNDLVSGSLFPEPLIGHECVCVDRAASGNASINVSAQFYSPGVC